MKTCSEAWDCDASNQLVANGIHVATLMEMKGLVTDVFYVCIRSLDPDQVFNPVGFFTHGLLHFSYKIFPLEINKKCTC